MALSQDDWGDILRHLRQRVQEAGLREIDELVVADFRPSNQRDLDLLRYLSSLISLLKEGSSAGYEKTLSQLREFVRTEHGGAVEGVEVLITDQDRQVFGADRLDLGNLPDSDAVVENLSELLDTLKRDRERDAAQ